MVEKTHRLLLLQSVFEFESGWQTASAELSMLPFDSPPLLTVTKKDFIKVLRTMTEKEPEEVEQWQILLNAEMILTMYVILFRK